MIRGLRDLMPVLRLFFAERRGALLVGLLLATATVLCGIGLLGLAGWFITATAIAGLSTAAVVFDVFMPSAGIRLLALGRTASRYAERLVTHDATLGVLAALRERLFRGWAAPGAAHRLLRQPARLLFRLTADVDALDSLYLRVVAPLAAALATALLIGAGLAFVDPLLAAGMAGALLLAGLGIPLVAASIARKPMRRRAAAVEALRARTIDLVRGQTELAMAGRLEAQRLAISAADARLAFADDQLNRIESGVAGAFGAASALLLAGVLLAVAALAGNGAITAPVAALVVLVATAAVEPFAGLRRGALELGRTLLAARRLAPRLAPTVPPAALARPAAGMAVVLDRVCVRHPDAAQPSLHELSLTIGRGERVAILGASGAGKSTLLALLAGEVAPEAGRIERLDATLLTQRTELYQDTLRDNLRLAAPAADDADLWASLRLAGLDEVAAALPAGLDTRLGEGGLGLSGGQARRLALARLVLRDTPVWLLDEATEGLDHATAQDVMRRLAAHADRRAVVIATHLRREAAIANRLLLMVDGRIVAEARRHEAAFAAMLAALRD